MRSRWNSHVLLVQTWNCSHFGKQLAVFNKLSIQLSYDTAVTLLGINTQENEHLFPPKDLSITYTGDVNFDPQGRWCLPIYSTYKVVINKYIEGDTLNYADILSLHQLLHINFSIHQWILPATIITTEYWRWFSISCIPWTFINWSSSVREICPPPPTALYLYV